MNEIWQMYSFLGDGASIKGFFVILDITSD